MSQRVTVRSEFDVSLAFDPLLRLELVVSENNSGADVKSETFDLLALWQDRLDSMKKVGENKITGVDLEDLHVAMDMIPRIADIMLKMARNQME